jgi:ribosome-associated heat shock protein Hsp15
MTDDAGPGLRLDKWLWFARFCKSRSLATKLCTEGRVRVDGSTVSKAHYTVRPGQVLTFAHGGHVRVIRVVALGFRRGPAPEAQALYEDLAPPTRASRLPEDPLVPATRDRGSGRPTKKERRAIDRLMEEE